MFLFIHPDKHISRLVTAAGKRVSPSVCMPIPGKVSYGLCLSHVTPSDLHERDLLPREDES